MKRGGTEEVVLKGVLEKVNKIGFNSKKLCVLSKTEFYYYADQKAHGSVKHMSLQEVQAVKRDHSSKAFQFEIIARNKTETFAAESLEICNHWLKAIQSTLLTNRRTSSTSSMNVDTAMSHLSQYGWHGYEEIDIDKTGQPVFSGNGPKSGNTAAGHNYETVDVDSDDIPKKSRPPRGVCTTVDALRGPPGTKLPNVAISPPQSMSPDRSSEPPLYSEAIKMEKPNAVKSKPPLSPKPPVSPKPVNYKAQTFELQYKQELPDTTGLCMTVDDIRGPPEVILGRNVPSASQSESQAEGIYSEALSEKRSDLYLESKSLNKERKEGKSSGSRSKGSELYDGDCSEGPASYSTTYSTVTHPDAGVYSDVNVVQARDQVRARSGIYSLAQPIDSNMSTIAEKPSSTEAVNGTEYSDAASCASSAKTAEDQPITSPVERTDSEVASTNSMGTLKDVNSNPISIPTLTYGAVNRSEAINKLELFLSTCGKP